jgi:hypothetical protein
VDDLVPYQGGGLDMSLPRIQFELCMVIRDFNQLRSFKLNDVEVLEWKDTLIRIKPDLTPAMLQYAIDRLMDGELEYNEKRGIQNIFSALKLIGENEDGEFYIKKPIW